MKPAKVAICTPCSGAKVDSGYMLSVRAFERAAAKRGIETRVLHTVDSLVQRARNTITHQALKTDAEWLLWIDSDIAFPASIPLKLIETGFPIVAAPYALKDYDFERVRAAAGVADQDLQTCGTFPVWNLWPNPKVDAHGSVSAKDVGTGFLLTHRDVYVEMAQKMPELRHMAHVRTHDPVTGEQMDTRERSYTWWDCQTDADENYLSEDWLFCRRAQSLGFDVRMMLLPGLVHYGPHGFRCDARRFVKGALVDETEATKPSAFQATVCGVTARDALEKSRVTASGIEMVPV